MRCSLGVGVRRKVPLSIWTLLYEHAGGSLMSTLVVMAAGMGSRYGGLKQVDPVGPSGETLLDFSIFDAVSVDVVDVQAYR